jgi:hypothetical protein
MFKKSKWVLALGISASLIIPSADAALTKSQRRYTQRFEVEIPTGSHSVSEFLKSVSELNPYLPLQLPKVEDQRSITIHQNYKGSTAIISVKNFIEMMNTKVPYFNNSYQWDIGKKGIILSSSLKPSPVPEPKKVEPHFSVPSWVKDLPTKNETIVSVGDAKLSTGNYTEPVTIKGDLELIGEKFAFKELNVDGNLKLNGQQISGKTFSLKGNVDMEAGSVASFETITTKGSLNLKPGSSVMVKDLVMDGGDIVLGENSHIILN